MKIHQFKVHTYTTAALVYNEIQHSGIHLIKDLGYD
jgi:hypothetical protein